MKRIKRTYWAIMLVIMTALGMTACGTQTHEEIKTIGNVQFLCTWTNYPSSPLKNDYRCVRMDGLGS
jgi:hypothetical protein